MRGVIHTFRAGGDFRGGEGDAKRDCEAIRGRGVDMGKSRDAGGQFDCAADFATEL